MSDGSKSLVLTPRSDRIDPQACFDRASWKRVSPDCRLHLIDRALEASRPTISGFPIAL